DYSDESEDEEEDKQKPTVESEKAKWETIRQAQLDRTTQHEDFFRALETSSDGFSTVANYFGLTVINYSN
ncbi:hypothetical protein EON65_30645, partial [archaeon]